MKKLITMSIIIFLMIGIFAGVVGAASASISVSTKAVEVGKNVSVTVNFGDKVSTAQFKLTYDESKFEYVSKSGPGNYNSGSKTYGFFTTDGSDPTYDRVVFTFKAKASGSVQFGLSGLKISTATQKNFAPSVSVSSASVTINEPVVATPTVAPTAKPTAKPVTKPTTKPTAKPTATATVTPTETPSIEPSSTPVVDEENINNNEIVNTTSPEIQEQNQTPTKEKTFKLEYISYAMNVLLIIILIIVTRKKK